ncbi:hypothetical protein Btru_009768 [Bulinus truncatus]|nr:hypothetical protein Btru_009768 [Bulinus truncatus]
MRYFKCRCKQGYTVCGTVSLSSTNFRYTSITVPFTIQVTSITLVNQVSNSPCTPDVSFGYSGPNIFATNGCRGEFSVCGEREENRLVTCESRNFRPAVCFTGVNIKYLSVRQQLSGSPCIENVTYSFSGAYILVNSGCRATFTVGIVQMAHSLGGEDDIAELLADKELSDDDLVNLVCESECDKSDEEELVPVTFTA